MSNGSFDVVVLGGGTGGYSTALRAAQLGKRVALVERDARLGGTCLLRGCIPTKALLRSAEVMDTVTGAGSWGIDASGAPDIEGIRGFRDTIVERLVTGLTHHIAQRKIEVLRGTGRLLEGPAVEVDGRAIDAGDVVIATGSRPRSLPNITEGPRVITSDRALELEFIPSSVVVIGAGAIGLEFASFYRSMGAEVTVVEALQRIAPGEDEDISKHLARSFKKRGITTHAEAAVTSVEADDRSVSVTFEKASGATTVNAEMCLVAVGRAPVSEGLAEAGVTLDRGFAVVDAGLRTNLEHVWAVGDVAATPLQFAHVAFAEGIAVAERIMGLDVPPMDYDGVARVTFCNPEIASVGLTEAQAREAGHDVRVQKFQFQGLGKAQIIGEGGIAKLVGETGGGRILGVHLIGPHATDLISEALVITNLGLEANELSRFIHPHPTLGEAMGEAILGLAGKALHV